MRFLVKNFVGGLIIVYLWLRLYEGLSFVRFQIKLLSCHIV